MIALPLCVGAAVAAYLAARRDLVRSLILAVTIGYFYGITRANLLGGISYFIFDSAVIGIYLGWLMHPAGADRYGGRALVGWIALLILWPTLLLLDPQQSLMVKLVGWRGNVFYWPLVLLGASLEAPDLQRLAKALAVLNIVVLGFGVAEYFFGVQHFYPYSPVTRLIYLSHDVDSDRYLRIPATFANAHAYGGAMTSSLAILIAALFRADTGRRWLLAAGMLAAGTGILLCAARSPVVFAGGLLLLAMWLVPPGRSSLRVALPLLVLATVVLALQSDRLQRAATLENRGFVEQRVSWSVNAGFWRILDDYPLGYGLGSGGTSIPAFLDQTVHRPPVVAENEYARVVIEQGWPGFSLLLGFLGWCLLEAWAGSRPPAQRLLRYYALASFAGAVTGVGLLLAVPGSPLLLLLLGISFSNALGGPRDHLALKWTSR